MDTTWPDKGTIEHAYLLLLGRVYLVLSMDLVGDELFGDLEYCHIEGSILFANHKANGVVTNIGLLANTVDDTGSYMAG